MSPANTVAVGVFCVTLHGVVMGVFCVALVAVGVFCVAVVCLASNVEVPC